MLAQRLLGAKVTGNAAPLLIGSSIVSGGVSTTIACPTPEGAESGDLLVAVGVSSVALTVFPSGWTQTLGSTNRFVVVGTHDGAASTYSFGRTSSTSITVALLCFRGCNYGVTGTLSAGVQDPVAPSITTTELVSTLIAWASLVGADHTYTPPSGWTIVESISTGGPSVCVAVKDTHVNAGAQATATFTRVSGTSTLSRAHQFSIHPT